MIKREVYLLKHLKHPRIMKMLQYFQSDNYVFIVTEYIPNGTLLQLIENYTRQQMKFTEKVFWQHNVLRKFRQLNIIQSFRKFWIIFATFCWHWNTYNLEVLFMVTWKVKTFWLVVMVGLKLAILVFPNVWTIRSSRMRYVSQKFCRIREKKKKIAMLLLYRSQYTIIYSTGGPLWQNQVHFCIRHLVTWVYFLWTLYATSSVSSSQRYQWIVWIIVAIHLSDNWLST